MVKSSIKLGQQQPYVDQYDPSLLESIPRNLSRQVLKINDFIGVDVWTAYELSWLDETGKPLVAIAEFMVPANSPNIVESKSFKYYLNSFSQTHVASELELKNILERDLSLVAGKAVTAELYTLEGFSKKKQGLSVVGLCIDDLLISEVPSEPNQDILQLTTACAEAEVSAKGVVWFSHLLKSNCPVTGQPDWASIWIGGENINLCPTSLLRYLVSYRKHQGFHESCVEKIFSDLVAVCNPKDLWVYARYTRRGGLDINPFRSLQPMMLPEVVAMRQ